MESRTLKGLGLAAGVVAALALYNRTLSRRITRRWPPIGRFVQAGPCRLHYVDQGRGRPVVLLHGASGSLNDFMLGLSARIARRYRVIAFDRPGHGHSTRPAGPMSPLQQAAIVREALHALGVERPILVGHSWAGALALAYALAWPDEIAGTVPVAGVAYSWQGNHIHWYARLGADPLFGPLFRHTLLGPLGQTMMAASVRHIFAPDPPMPAYADRIGAPLVLRPDQFAANAWDLVGLKAFLAIQDRHYSEISCPVGIVAPSEDRRVANVDHHSRRLERDVPQGRLFIAEGAGHMPHHTRPSVVIQAIDWVAERSRPDLRPTAKSASSS